jgi:hypothetical protein
MKPGWSNVDARMKTCLGLWGEGLVVRAVRVCLAGLANARGNVRDDSNGVGWEGVLCERSAAM